MKPSKDRIFRIIKKTREGEERYFPQFQYKRWSGMWWLRLLDGWRHNDWSYWIGTLTYWDEYSGSFIPVSHKTISEAESFIDSQRVYDNNEHEVVA